MRFIDVWEAIATFQPSVARLAATKAGPADIAELEKVTGALKRAKTSQEVVKHGVGFLFAIGRVTANNVIEVMLRSLNILAHSMLDRVIDRLPDAQGRIALAQTKRARALH